MKIIFGTTNLTKVERVANILHTMGINIAGLDKNLPKVEENGKTVLENARKKAVHYSNLVEDSVLGMDTSLYFDNLPAEDQPALFVRKFNSDHHMSDQEMIKKYSGLISKYGGRITGYWETAWVLAKDGKIIKEIVVKTPKRYYISKPSSKITKGMPINSLQIDPKTGKYFSEMTADEHDKIWRAATGMALKKIFHNMK